MAVTTDILKTWRRPGAVFRPRLAQATEPGALAVLMGACFLIFVSQWPALSRQAYLAQIAAEQVGTPPDQVPQLQALIGINLFVLMFMAPLIFYAIAWLSGVVLRAFGRPVAPLGARMALFWALLATAPLMLFQGLIAGFVGPGPALTVVGFLVLLAFLWLWQRLLREAMA
ncbi:YIP1 family protein [Neotabrizicola sp. VNH66]|uniref:YIP1 family protein n=1 Tax=Neotabrizicola sp. VNH66 TaxID=3400918 RepID=UPI003C0AEFE6